MKKILFVFVCILTFSGCVEREDYELIIPCHTDYDYSLKHQAADSIAFFDSKHGIIGIRSPLYTGDEQVTLLGTGDGGHTWSDYSRSIYRPGSSFPMQMTGQSDIYMVNAGTLHRSVTGGYSWTPMPTASTEYWSSIGFSDATHAFRAGFFRPDYITGIAAYSTDGGETWTRSDPPGAHVGRSYFINNSVGWFVSSNQVYKTTDGAQTWTLLYEYLGDGSTYYMGNYFFLDSNNGWIASHLGILRTSDGGSTWSLTGNGAQWIILRVLFLSQMNGFIVATPSDGSTPMGLYKTINGGTTWIRILENVEEIISVGDYLIASAKDEKSGYLYFSTDQFTHFEKREAPLKSTEQSSHLVMGYPFWACM